jgi:hypothetical protein
VRLTDFFGHVANVRARRQHATEVGPARLQPPSCMARSCSSRQVQRCTTVSVLRAAWSVQEAPLSGSPEQRTRLLAQLHMESPAQLDQELLLQRRAPGFVDLLAYSGEAAGTHEPAGAGRSGGVGARASETGRTSGTVAVAASPLSPMLALGVLAASAGALLLGRRR